jgi:hypothetical protein
MRAEVWLASAWLICVCSLTAVQPEGPPAKELTYEEVIKQTLSSLNQMTKALEPVKDEPSAKAALADLKKAAEQFIAVRKKAEQLNQPDLSAKDELDKKYKKQLVKAVLEFRAKVREVQEVPGSQELLKILEPVLKSGKKK